MAPERCSSMPGKTARSSRTADSRLVPRACIQSSSVRAITFPQGDSSRSLHTWALASVAMVSAETTRARP